MYEPPESDLEDLPELVETLIQQQRVYISWLIAVLFPFAFLFLVLYFELPIFSIFVPGFLAGAIVKFTANMVESRPRKIHGIIFGVLIALVFFLISDSAVSLIVVAFLSNSFMYYMVSERNLSQTEEQAMMAYEKSKSDD